MMMSEMPLPRPRSVMRSPSHMTNRVRAGEDDDAHGHPPGAVHRSCRRVNGGVDVSRGLEDADDDGEVARPLVQLAPTAVLFLHLLHRGNGDTHQLHDDAGADVGHDAQREDARAREGPSREDGQQFHQAAAAMTRCFPVWHCPPPEAPRSCRCGTPAAAPA